MSADPIDKLYRLDGVLQGRPDGLQASYEYSDDEWRTQAEQVAYKLAQAGAPFTVDDLRKHGVPDPDKPQRWGSLIAALATLKVIELEGLALHRSPGGAIEAVRVWVGGPAAYSREQAA